MLHSRDRFKKIFFLFEWQLINHKNDFVFRGSMVYKRMCGPLSLALLSSMGRGLSGLVVVSAILAATFVHQEIKLSEARDAWRMEDNMEERRKKEKVGTLTENDHDQQISIWQKFVQREEMLKMSEKIKDVVSLNKAEEEPTPTKRRESISSRREEKETTSTRRREAVSSQRT